MSLKSPQGLDTAKPEHQAANPASDLETQSAAPAPFQPGRRPPGPLQLLAVQRTLGNQAASRLLTDSGPGRASLQRTGAHPPTNPAGPAQGIGGATAAPPIQHSPIIQRGGVPWVEHGSRIYVEKIGSSGGITAHYTKDSSGNYYVEGWVEGTTEPSGEVKIEPGDTLALHTKSDSSARGGLGDKLMAIAVKQIAKHHSSAEKVLLPMGGGAVIKMMIGALSKVFGDPEIHAKAEAERKRRKLEQERELKEAPSDEAREEIKARRKQGVSEFSPDFLGEHGLHMNALLSTDKGQRIEYISQLYVKLEPEEDTEMSIQAHLQRMLLQPSMQVTMPMDLFLEFAASL